MENSITYNKDGTPLVFSGPDGVNCIRAAYLAQALGLYAACRMLPTRGVTAGALLKMATGYTGKTYKRGEYERASKEVFAWVREMKDALPHEVVG